MGDQNTQPPISCFWGTPYQDPVTGAWRCPEDVTKPTPVTPVGGGAASNPPFGQLPINIYFGVPANYPALLPATLPGSQPTIFGMSPLMALAVGAGALFLLSSAGGDDRKK